MNQMTGWNPCMVEPHDIQFVHTDSAQGWAALLCLGALAQRAEYTMFCILRYPGKDLRAKTIRGRGSLYTVATEIYDFIDTGLSLVSSGLICKGHITSLKDERL